MSTGNLYSGPVAARLADRGRPREVIAGRAGATSHSTLAWVFLVAIFTPAAITAYLGGVKFTVGRIIISFLLLPALAKLFGKGRRLIAADFFAIAAAIWMIGATLQTDARSWSSAMAMALEFLGGYIIARAYFFGNSAVGGFVQVLKVTAIVLIGLALLEHLTGETVVYNIVARLWNIPPIIAEIRHGMPRAFSTFPHPILYGTFCVVAGAIFLYCARNSGSRMLYAALCLFGCILALSSAPLISFMIVLLVFAYDRLMPYSWRWHALVICVGIFLAIVFLVTNNPTSWIIANLTIDPATGYFRKATWDTSLYYIGLSPWLGYGFDAYAGSDDFFGNASVDSVWLVLALRFGVPFVILVILANITAFYPSPARTRSKDPQMSDMRTAFTLAVVILMFTGLTVHYWNSIWILWGVCIGIRAAIRENDLVAARESRHGPRSSTSRVMAVAPS